MLRSRALPQHFFRPIRRHISPPNLRFYATKAKANPSERVSRLESRLPRFLSRILVPLRTAPISHITAFLILHEITAIAPIFGLTAAFHYYNWLPPYISEWKWVSDYTAKSGDCLRKRGWIKEEGRGGRWFGRGEKGTRLVVELATSYAIVKAFLPVRLVISVWATPWFARWTVLPVTRRLGRMFSGKKGTQAAVATGAASSKGVVTSPAAGTNAVGGGVLPKVLKPD